MKLLNFKASILSVWLIGALLTAFGAEPPEATAVEPTADPASVSKAAIESETVQSKTLLDRPERAPEPLLPGEDDPSIAMFAARLLEANHYSRQEFDDEISGKFFDHYLNLLDPQHLHFLQSDIEEFEKYRTTLDDLTLLKGDTSPAYAIMLRFRERLAQRVAFAKEKLKTEPLVFESEEKVVLNRSELPRPKNLEEAKELWLRRLRFEMLEEKLNKEPPEEIVNIITRRYSRLQRAIYEMDSGDTLQTYLTALANVYDPHSDYMGRNQLENFAISMNLSLFGIGAVLQSEDGYCKIKELVAGGPAERSRKLKVGDRIVAVAQGEEEPVDIVDMKLTKAVDLIRGPKDTEVRLTVIPNDAVDSSVRKTVSIIRDKIQLEDAEAKASLIELPDRTGTQVRIGVIDLPSFYSTFAVRGQEDSGVKSTTKDVALLLKKLKEEHVEGVILDLRRNGGGSLEEAIKLTGLFIKEGPVVQVKDTFGFKIVDSDEDPTMAYEGPLIVLTSRFSASASEILAGALQDYGRAVIVGDASTHGKGTVQAVYQLADYMRRANFKFEEEPGALKMTIRKFYRASGDSTQLRGVTPDIVLPSVNNEADVGEDSLDNPLPWDTEDSAGDIADYNLVRPFLNELRERSRGRISTDQEYAWIQDDIQEYRKAREDKSISLNEEERLKEKEKAEQRKELRKEAREARPLPDETIYEISLKQAAEPGLPEPTPPWQAASDHSVPHLEHELGLPPSRLPNKAEIKIGEFKPTEDLDNKSDSERMKSLADGSDTEDSTDESSADAQASADAGAEEDDTPTVDPALDEAKRILLDYIRLLPKTTIANFSGTADVNL